MVEQNSALQAAFGQLAVAVQDGLEFVVDLGETFYERPEDDSFASGSSTSRRR